MNKESGSPDPCPGARLLQQPYFLSAECASRPESFLCNRNTFFITQKTGANVRYGIFTVHALTLTPVLTAYWKREILT